MRTSGVLMHISSLPSPYGIGTMGKKICRFFEKGRSEILADPANLSDQLRRFSVSVFFQLCR